VDDVLDPVRSQSGFAFWSRSSLLDVDGCNRG